MERVSACVCVYNEEQSEEGRALTSLDQGSDMECSVLAWMAKRTSFIPGRPVAREVLPMLAAVLARD